MAMLGGECSAGMREAAAAQELGLNLTQLQSGNVEAMNDAIGRVGMSFRGITNQITAMNLFADIETGKWVAMLGGYLISAEC